MAGSGQISDALKPKLEEENYSGSARKLEIILFLKSVSHMKDLTGNQ